MVPVPMHSTPGQALVSVPPHGTVAGFGHDGMHSHTPAALQREPAAQRVPRPHAAAPGQMFGISAPHATVAGSVDGHAGMHSHERPLQR